MTDTYFQINSGFGAGWGFFPILFSTLPAILLLIFWLFVGGALVMRENAVDKPNRVAQLYGYTVCLIALVLALISIAGLLDSAFERGHPLQGGDFPFGVSLTSFEAFKARRGSVSPFEREAQATPDTVSESTLRARYDALVAERLESVRYRTSKELVSKGLLLLISLTLFGFHWRWVRRLNGAPGATAG